MSFKASVIDLFAGPGGLGEGFSAFRDPRNQAPFSIQMSVEMEPNAHKTLELRAFYRWFGQDVPSAYYSYLKGELSREDLFTSFPKASASAREETLGQPTALGDEDGDRRVLQRLRALRRVDEPLVVIGGPPCQAYSLVGRARNKGVVGYRPEEDRRHFLYQEYLQILCATQPEVFVMENVKGILSSRVGGQRVFPRILEDLSHPGRALRKRGGKAYKIYAMGSEASTDDLFRSNGSDFIIRSELFGIPQARHRVILLGVRDDLVVTPPRLVCRSLRPAGTVLMDIAPLRSGLSRGVDSPEDWFKAIQKAATKVSRELSKLEIEATRLADLVERSSRLRTRGDRYVRRRRKFRGDDELATWLLDSRLDGFLNHESRGHMERDLERYMFCSCYALFKAAGSPRAHHFPTSLAPLHVNWKSGKFADRFKVQLADRPSSTVTSHISKDGHYYIHYDPAQCRSLTVREAARLQTFPDNYFFEGNRTQKYVQVGNAVPPLLAHQIARIVHEVLTKTA